MFSQFSVWNNEEISVSPVDLTEITLTLNGLPQIRPNAIEDSGKAITGTDNCLHESSILEITDFSISVE